MLQRIGVAIVEDFGDDRRASALGPPTTVGGSDKAPLATASGLYALPRGRATAPDGALTDGRASAPAAIAAKPPATICDRCAVNPVDPPSTAGGTDLLILT